jgi:hypothetical protein
LETTIHFYYPTLELFCFSFTQPFTHSKFCLPNPFLLNIEIIIGLICSAPLDYYCDHPVDVALLLDSSSDFKQVNFEAQKKFAESFITYFKLRSILIGGAIAIVPYSDKKITRLTIRNFYYSRSIAGLTRKIKTLKYLGGKSNLQDAFRFVTDELFVPTMGARSWVPRVVVAITGSWRTWSSWQTREVLNNFGMLTGFSSSLCAKSHKPWL